MLGLAGNTAGVAVLPEVKDDLRGWRLGRVVTVVDRGFSSKANLDYLRRAGGHWIAGERMRDGNAHAQAALSRQGRYRQVRDNLRVKEVTLDGESGVRWIVCHNPHEAERDAARRTEALTRLSAELERIKTARTRDVEGRRTTAPARPHDRGGPHGQVAVEPDRGRRCARHRTLEGVRAAAERPARVRAHRSADGCPPRPSRFLLSLRSETQGQ